MKRLGLSPSGHTNTQTGKKCREGQSADNEASGKFGAGYKLEPAFECIPELNEMIPCCIATETASVLSLA
jgi:hypothetical protein